MELSLFLIEMIEELRKSSKLSKCKNKKTIELRNLISSPCQITVLWLKNELNIDLQFCCISHNKNHKDLNVKIIGPINLKSKKEYKKIEQYLNSKHLYYFLEDNEKEKNDLESAVIAQIRAMLKYEINYYSPPIGTSYKFSHGTLTQDIHFLYSLKKINSRNVRSPVEKLLKYIQICETIYEEEQSEHITSKFMEWRLDKDIWIGKIPEYTFEDKIFGKTVEDYIKCVVKGTIYGNPIEIFSDGYCRLYYKDKDLDDNVKISIYETLMNLISNINDFLMCFILFGHMFPEVTLDNIRFKKNIIKSPNSLNSFLPFPPTSDNLKRFYTQQSEDKFRSQYIEEVDFSKYTIIPKSQVEMVLHYTEKIKLPQFNDVYKILQFLHLANTIVLQHKYDIAFILIWSAIEQIIFMKWKILFEIHKKNGKLPEDEKNLDKEIRSISKKIIDLHSWGEIKTKHKVILLRLAKRRNLFLHDLKSIDMLSIKQCFSALRGVSKQYFDYIKEQLK